MAKSITIDINCDLGEGLDNESVLMPYLSSCNIACGGHAGSAATLDRVIRLAQEHGVKVGAHPSYPDQENFGRIRMDLSRQELQNSLREQLQLFKARAQKQNIAVHHVKPHGALYNEIAADAEKAHWVAAVVQEVFPNTVLFAPYQSQIAAVAQQYQIPVSFEAFADRNYNADLSLVARNKPQALLNEPEAVVAHVYQMAKYGQVKTVQGSLQTLKAQTFCVHGDHPNAVSILKALHQHFVIFNP